MKLIKVLSIFALSSLIFSSCSSSSGATNVTIKKASIFQSDWKLIGEDNTLIKGFNGENVTLVMNETDFNVNGYAGCNRFSSTLITDDNNIHFGPIMSSKMACPSSKVEANYLKLLKDVNRYEVKGNEMYLYKNNMLLLKFIH